MWGMPVTVRGLLRLTWSYCLGWSSSLPGGLVMVGGPGFKLGQATPSEPESDVGSLQVRLLLVGRILVGALRVRA